jgi:hypothetical protein
MKEYRRKDRKHTKKLTSLVITQPCVCSSGTVAFLLGDSFHGLGSLRSSDLHHVERLIAPFRSSNGPGALDLDRERSLKEEDADSWSSKSPGRTVSVWDNAGLRGGENRAAADEEAGRLLLAAARKGGEAVNEGSREADTAVKEFPRPLVREAEVLKGGEDK